MPSAAPTAPADTLALAPSSANRMPPAPDRIPTMQEILPASSFASPLRPSPLSMPSLMSFVFLLNDFGSRSCVVFGGEKLHCSTRMRRSSSAATDCTGRRTLLRQNKPIFTLMYSPVSDVELSGELDQYGLLVALCRSEYR